MKAEQVKKIADEALATALQQSQTLTRERKTTPPDLLQFFNATEANLIGSTFHRMDIAEDEIARAKGAFPLLETKLHNAFRFLCPTIPLQRLSDTVYRHHCRELLERIVNDADLKPGTSAEVLAKLAEASLVAPLTRTATILYWNLFQRILPDHVGRISDDIGPLSEDDYHEQQARHFEAKLRRQLACDRTP